MCWEGLTLLYLSAALYNLILNSFHPLIKFKMVISFCRRASLHLVTCLLNSYTTLWHTKYQLCYFENGLNLILTTCFTEATYSLSCKFTESKS
jgi:hypothetical protein